MHKHASRLMNPNHVRIQNTLRGCSVTDFSDHIPFPHIPWRHLETPFHQRQTELNTGEVVLAIT